MKKLLSLIVVGAIFVAVLKLGGFNFDSFSHETHLRNPKDVFSPYLPDNTVTTTVNNNSNGYVFDPNAKIGGGSNSTTESYAFDPDAGSKLDSSVVTKKSDDASTTSENTKTTKAKDDSTYDSLVSAPDNKTLAIELSRIFKITINGKEYELSSKNTVSFIKWLNGNYKKGSKVEVEPKEEADLSKVDNTTILNGEDLSKIISSVKTAKSLPNYTDYDRNTFEKPVQSYTLDGKKVNRNDYAWKTSPYFNEKDFTYTCPYTGKVIKDTDDNKEDKDFGNLDYDHLIPLKSAYLRGAKDWTEEQKNAYAYDQSVGVDVIASANRSKSDKGPAEWLPDVNRGSYCYSWLVICQKYNLTMTEEEIKICNDEISKAIKNGEEVRFMGGSYKS